MAKIYSIMYPSIINSNNYFFVCHILTLHECVSETVSETVSVGSDVTIQPTVFSCNLSDYGYLSGSILPIPTLFKVLSGLLLDLHLFSSPDEWPALWMMSPPSSPLCFPVALRWALRCSMKAAWGCGGSVTRWRLGPCWGQRATHSVQTPGSTAKAASPMKTTNLEQFVSAATRMRRWSGLQMFKLLFLIFRLSIQKLGLVANFFWINKKLWVFFHANCVL